MFSSSWGSIQRFLHTPSSTRGPLDALQIFIMRLQTFKGSRWYHFSKISITSRTNPNERTTSIYYDDDVDDWTVEEGRSRHGDRRSTRSWVIRKHEDNGHVATGAGDGRGHGLLGMGFLGLGTPRQVRTPMGPARNWMTCVKLKDVKIHARNEIHADGFESMLLRWCWSTIVVFDQYIRLKGNIPKVQVSFHGSRPPRRAQGKADALATSPTAPGRDTTMVGDWKNLEVFNWVSRLSSLVAELLLVPGRQGSTEVGRQSSVDRGRSTEPEFNYPSWIPQNGSIYLYFTVT